MLEVKEEKIKKVETQFHKYAEKRVASLAQQRRNRGLNVEGPNADGIVPVKRKRKEISELATLTAS